ncbi:hypothetical protein EBB54_17645 [Schaedlerella arabinosiphila]|uniref:Uncharacterized protein n=1 Tax=Schaedlerella arabinosiphila TaxID=2044587 RepID=A0A426DJJ8_9FIRM|nr:hypothetical protein EBB54_17645 [Schaedlerella arabinosiphila]
MSRLFHFSPAGSVRAGNGADKERGRSNPAGSIRIFRCESSFERADGNRGSLHRLNLHISSDCRYDFINDFFVLFMNR